MKLDQAVGAGDVCGAVAVLGKGEWNVGDLTGYLADDLPELLDAEPADVLAAGGGVLVGAASRVHDLAADLRDAILIQAADGELDAEPGVGIAQVVEIDATRLDAHFVTMFLRADANALPVANTQGALSRDDLRRCRIPRMPVAEQRRYGEAFRHLLDLQGALSALAAVSVNVLDQTIHGLTTGALTPRALTARENIAVHATESEK